MSSLGRESVGGEASRSTPASVPGQALGHPAAELLSLQATAGNVAVTAMIMRQHAAGAEDPEAPASPARMTEEEAHELFDQTRPLIDTNPAEAVEPLQRIFRAVHLGPEIRSMMANNISVCYERMGQRDQAIRWAITYMGYTATPEELQAAEARVRRLQTGGPSPPRTLQAGDPSQMTEEEARERFNQVSPLIHTDPGAALGPLQEIYGATGLGPRIRSSMAGNISLCYEGLNQPEEATRWLGRSIELGMDQVEMEAAEGRMERLRTGAAGARDAAQHPASSEMTEQDAHELFERVRPLIDSDPQQAVGPLQDIYYAVQLGPRIRSMMANNLSTCYERMGDETQARRWLGHYIELALTPNDRRTAEARLERLGGGGSPVAAPADTE